VRGVDLMSRTSGVLSGVHTEDDIDTALGAFDGAIQAMLEEGIYIAPSQFEAGFMTTAHTEKDIEQTIEANFKALKIAKG